MDKYTQLIKFGTVLKQRRLALKLSLRELEKLSSVSAALITKLENGKMANFPKTITIKQLSDALKFNNELFVLADILFEHKEQNIPDKTFEDELRELLATKTTLNSENITQVIYLYRDSKNCKKFKTYKFSDLNLKLAILFRKIPDT